MSIKRARIVVSFLVVAVFVNGAIGIKCKACKSTININCYKDPLNGELGECETSETSCYQYVDKDGVTYRGCTAPDGECTDPLCEKCEDENCNTGIVPETRQSCIQCTNCISIDGLKGYPCQLYKDKDQCYSSFLSETVAMRGCISEPNNTCTEDHNCLKCSGKDCNVALPPKNTCIECDSKKNNNNACKRPEKSEDCPVKETLGTCKVAVTGTDKPKCYIYSEGDSVVRGCGNNLPTVQNDGNLEICEGDNCNNKCRLDIGKCYDCDSKQDPNCKDSGKLESFSKNCTDYTTGCSLCENTDGTEMTRQCGDKKADGFFCKPCLDQLCNKLMTKSCHICNSTSDPLCVKGEGPTGFCAKEDEKCFETLDKDGITIRGCTTDKCPTDQPKCNVCDNHNCNSNTLVDNPSRCYTCTDTGDCIKQQTNETKLADCLRAGEPCFMFSNNNTTMIRGCIGSTLPDECTKGDNRCVTCLGDGCNSRAMESESGLQCIQCKADDQACAWQHSADMAQNCSAKLIYYLPDLCYTMTQTDGSVSRGCLSSGDATDCTLTNSKCRVCYDNGCNTESSKTFSCVRCRSSTKESCGKKETNIEKSECSNIPTNTTRGCYTERLDGVIYRGCISDLRPDEIQRCTDPKYKWCETCSDEGCNKSLFVDSSTLIQASIGMVLACLAILLS